MDLGLLRRGGSDTPRVGVLLFGIVAVAVCALLFLQGNRTEVPTSATACAEGEGEAGYESEEAEREASPPADSAVSDFYRGPAQEVPCASKFNHPESFADLALANSSRLTRTVAWPLVWARRLPAAKVSPTRPTRLAATWLPA